MTKSVLTFGLILGLGTLTSITSEAGAVSFSLGPSTQDVTVGSSFEVTVDISGLGSGVAPSVGEFDFNFSFDPSIVAITGLTFGEPPDLGFDFVDLSGTARILTGAGLGPFLGASVVSPGTVNFFEISFDAPGDLNALQPDSITLATLAFDAIAPGSSSLDLSVIALGDAVGDPLSIDSVGGASVTVNTTSVIPEPSSIVGSIVGVGIAGWLRKRKHKKCL